MIAIKILIVDDEQPARKKIRSYLKEEQGIDSIIEAENGIDAVKLIHEKKPDLVFLDIQMPGLNGFVSEFLVVRGSWPILTFYTALSMIGLLITGAYILKGIKQVLHGPLNEKWLGHRLEINRREVLAIAPLMVLMLLIGVWPSWILEVINKTVMRLFG